MSKYPDDVIKAIELLESSGLIVIDPATEFTVSNYCRLSGENKTTVMNWCSRDQIKHRVITQLNNLKLVQPGTEETKMITRK